MNRFFMSLALVMFVTVSTLENSWAQETSKKPLESQPEGKPLQPDAAATRLMSDTHDHWAHWTDFPGVTADVEVNLNGDISRGRVQVSPKGKVELKLTANAHSAGSGMLGGRGALTGVFCTIDCLGEWRFSTFNWRS
ncbi:hypothetical protein [Lignipirellula cremea]|uniref:Uncharacterized protein n=1 Tax=Lignipirellula cremea TaxID=2528010 RepID=A0A518DV05_9BACT|nr:hypothetical protein [Lignipirellula cremea]QDU95659.1 hypothetical protein Pla8534_34760 [Lignipirellula cremea]